MTEALHAKRRADKLKDYGATLVVALILALLCALLLEGLAVLVGAVTGNPAWHRTWVDERLGKGIEGLQALPPLIWLAELLAALRAWLPPQGFARDVLAFALGSFPLGLVPAKHIGPTLIARYDDEALRVLPPRDLGLRWAGPLGDAQRRTWDDLLAWCHAGTGNGRCPGWRPWAMPGMDQPLAIALLTGPNGVGKSHLAEALARHLDGSNVLEALPGRWARLRYRLRVKINDCQWWRRRRPDDPWDCGYLVDDAAWIGRLAHFLPRRATLLIADELTAESLNDITRILAERRVEFRRPVRLLLVDVTPPAGLDLR